MSDIQREMDGVIQELEKRGIDMNSHTNPEMIGLGDVIEDVLKSFGITQERFKQWFGLQECGCSRRKAWLNRIFSWKKNQA